MNSMVAFAIAIGRRGALGGAASLFVCWHMRQVKMKTLQGTYTFGQKNAPIATVKSCQHRNVLCYELMTKNFLSSIQMKCLQGARANTE